MAFEDTIRQLQDTLVVVTAIQDRQARVQKLQAEELDAMRAIVREHEGMLREHEEMMREHDRVMRAHDRAIEAHNKAMAELDDGIPKLLSVIGELLGLS